MPGSTVAKSPTRAPATSGYRPELDGLRGIAIALVVVFHVFVGRVSGGVDVFLLLSGYFFLGSQLRYASRPTANLNPWWPFWRVVRRLVPALAVTLAATTVAVLTLTPQLVNPEITRQITAALGYVLNWELINQEAAYAAASVDTSPLQHLWSMSVQGQFYVFAILFALGLGWLARRRGLDADDVRQIAGPILVGVTLTSFIWAARHGLVGTPDNYYSTFSRAWELTLGAVLALYRDRLRLPAVASAPAAAVGLTMIVMTGFIVPTSLAFPGPAALLPIGGAILIMLGDGRNPVAGVLSTGPAQWLGRIAYSLYLWHWPMLIILTVALGQETPSIALGVGVVAASLLLADLTHRYVESPLRQHASRPTADDDPVRAGFESLRHLPGRARAVGGVVVAALVVALLAVQPAYSSVVSRADGRDLDPRSYPGAMALYGSDAPDVPVRPSPAVVAGIYPAPGEEGCLVFIPEPDDYYPTEKITGEPCVYGDVEAETTVVVAGGSHAEPWTEPLDILGREHGFRVVPFLRQECPIVLGEHYGVSDECAIWSEGAIERMIDLDPAVVVSTSTRPQDAVGVGPDIVPKGYEGFWQALDDAGVPFLGLRDNPWVFTEDHLPSDANYCLIDENTDDMSACSMDRELVYADADPAAAIMTRFRDAHAVDTSGWFCDGDVCPPVIGNIPVFRDQNHISNAYARSTAPLLWERLEAFVE